MNYHCVPDFDFPIDDQDYASSLPMAMPSAPKKPSIADDDIMELLWQNGQVVMQSQNQRPLRKPPPPPVRNNDYAAAPLAGPSAAKEIRSEVENCNQHLFMEEGEMASWLHYPIDDGGDDPPLDQSFCADFLYNPPPPPAVDDNSAMQTPAPTSRLTDLRKPPMSAASPRPPIPPPRRAEQAPPRIMEQPKTSQNFACLWKHNNARAEPGPSSISRTAARESTVVDSCDTPAAPAMAPGAPSMVSETVRSSAGGASGVAAAPSTTFDDPGGSSSSGEPAQKVAAQDRKRKGREAEEWECQSEDVDFESAEGKKQVRGSSSSTKRSRAAEVHNLSERRRRDRINEKMRALQELIPRCNKSDKASMLDEAIEYLKSLQLQVQRVHPMQMMSMGCGMVPMMFPGIQQYMPAMGMGIGMGMGMDMGMNRPVMPFPNMFPGSALPTAATAAAHLGPRFGMPPFHMPHVPAPDSSGMQAATLSDNNMLNSVGAPDPNQSRIPNFSDPYQQFLGPHQMQFQIMQNQATNQPSASNPSNSRGPENQ